MDLSALAGNAALKEQLSAQDRGRGLSHAYLISGAAGTGKKTLARLMAAAMVCTGEGQRPCLRCPGCKKALGGIHPDVIWVAGPGGKPISVDQARSVRSDAYIRPNEAPRKVYILQEAQAMNANAQNALLKLLEEGPAYAAFLLLTDNPGGVLETIRSRCEGISLSPVSRAEAEAYLLRRFPDKPRQEVLSAAERCEGILGRAAEELEGSRDDGPVRQGAEALLARLAARNELELAAWAVSIEKWDRESLSRLFEATVELLREALALQAGAPASQDSPAVRQAAGLPRKTLLQCVDLLQELRSAAAFNVGAGHLCGALAAGLSRAVLSSTQTQEV